MLHIKSLTNITIQKMPYNFKNATKKSENQNFSYTCGENGFKADKNVSYSLEIIHAFN